jgi:hypothetical protein
LNTGQDLPEPIWSADHCAAKVNYRLLPCLFVDCYAVAVNKEACIFKAYQRA